MRPQDNLGVCADITVVEALRTIIDPEAYTSEQNHTSPKSSIVNSIKIDTESIKRIKELDLNKLAVKHNNYLSATDLGKLKNKNYAEVIKEMNDYKLVVSNNIITKQGKEFGIKFKQNNIGGKYIVYPESLAELL